MSEVNFTSSSIGSRKHATPKIAPNIKKRESVEISKFQAIGYYLRKADQIVANETFQGPSAMIQFGFDVYTLGYDEYAPVHILSAPNWKIRMYAAWCILSTDERVIAANSNYDDLYNYWPNVDFREAGWDDEVRQWAARSISTEPTDEHPIELEIASWVGQPPRPPIVYRE
jgi:hypothetical protein